MQKHYVLAALTPSAYAAISSQMNMNHAVPMYRASEVDARIAELEKYKQAVDEHNEQCQQRCGVGDQEAVRCQYRPYFVNSGRRCPDCPVNEMIDISLMESGTK